ncbi:unnamed protein product [marine sediment metagenome]|uniref:Uncharacterized protein n=1 Tax=marine sediment metagenome TaxID=412755 RepID=X1TBA0_9ZZZZ
MKRVYYLEVERVNNTDTVKGSQYIHDAILGIEGTLRKLIQDTTKEEHSGLVAVAESWREATPDEIAQLEALPPTPEPTPDELRASEILATSPEMIPQTEIVELLRIICRRINL